MPEMVLTPCGQRCDLCEAWRGSTRDVPRQVRALDEHWRRQQGRTPAPARGSCEGCPAALT